MVRGRYVGCLNMRRQIYLMVLWKQLWFKRLFISVFKKSGSKVLCRQVVRWTTFKMSLFRKWCMDSTLLTMISFCLLGRFLAYGETIYNRKINAYPIGSMKKNYLKITFMWTVFSVSAICRWHCGWVWSGRNENRPQTWRYRYGGVLTGRRPRTHCEIISLLWLGNDLMPP